MCQLTCVKIHFLQALPLSIKVLSLDLAPFSKKVMNHWLRTFFSWAENGPMFETSGVTPNLFYV